MIKCDFCGKEQKSVPKIIVGKQGIAICGECVLTCMEILWKETKMEYRELKFDDK